MKHFHLKITSFYEFIVLTIWIFYQAIFFGKSDIFSESQKELVKEGYQDTLRAFDIKEGLLSIVFRVGYDGEPSALSIKNSPVIQY